MYYASQARTAVVEHEVVEAGRRDAADHGEAAETHQEVAVAVKGAPARRRPFIIAPPRPGWVQPLKSASVSIKIRSKQPIKNIYSPTHNIKIDEHKDWDVVINWSKNAGH